MECRIQKGSCTRISFAIVIPHHSELWSRTCQLQLQLVVASITDYWLSSLPVGEMSCLYYPLFRASSRPRSSPLSRALFARPVYSNRTLRYYTASSNMSDLFVELTAPNGRKYKQPRGLFINNEFVKSKSGETITSINPRYVM